MKKIVITFLVVLLIIPTKTNAWWSKGLLVFNEYPVAASEEYFKTLYTAIYDKYLWQVKLSDLASASIASLNEIEQSIRVAIEPDRILIYNHQAMVKSFRKPSNDSPQEWARLTVEAIVTARIYSKKIQSIKTDDIYQIMTEVIINKLDGFSRYIKKSEAAKDNDSFAETGIRFKKVGRLLEVVSIISGSSAEYAHINIGDFISHIEGELISPMDSQILIDKLNGKKGTEVELTIINHQTFETKDVKLKRMVVSPYPISYEFKDNILFIMIYGFNKATVGAVREAVIKSLTEDDVKGIIIDLRGNLGGIFEQAIDVANLFLTRGAIVSTKGRHANSYQYYEADKDALIVKGMPIVVLIDGKTASAAEILAASLQDNGRAIVLGTTSYGKGLVQTVVHLPDNNEVSLTWSRFHAPSGYPLHSLGVLPNICYNEKKAASNQSEEIETLSKKYSQITNDFKDWRSLNPDDEKAHQRMREVCSPQSRFFEEDDKILAKEIILDEVFYNNVIDNFKVFINK